MTTPSSDESSRSPLPYPDADVLADHWWWRPGWHVGTRYYSWFITVADLTALADHVGVFQGALQAFEFLDLVPRRWLHITIQGLDHSHAVSRRQRTNLFDSVRQRLIDLPRCVLMFGQPVLFSEAVVIPPIDPDPLLQVRNAIRAGIEATYGPVPGLPSSQVRPHISVAYVNSAADPRPVRAVLDRVAMEPVEVTIPRVALIELHRDHKMYEWRVIDTISLGTK